MTTASVGFHCPECVSAGGQRVYTSATLWSSRPWVTQALIALNVAVFVVSLAMGDSVQFRRIAPGGLLVEGAVFGPFIDVQGEWWRIFTGGFLHGGLLHLGLNMYALWILGSAFERRLGPLRFGLVYAASLVAGSMGALLVDPLAFTVGASGAIYGLFGLAVASQRSSGISIWETGLGTVLIINLVLTFGIPGISVGGHLGGLVGGFCCGLVVEELPRRFRGLPSIAPPLAVVALGAAFFGGALWAATTWTNPIF